MKNKIPKRRRHLLKPSTLAFIREARRTPGYSFSDWLHGYIYARWPYLYIGIGTGEHRLTRLLMPIGNGLMRLFRRPSIIRDQPDRNVRQISTKSSRKRSKRLTFADTYHGKVVPLKAAKQLVTIDHEVNLTDLEQIIPYSRARDIVLKNPDHILLLECPCRASRPNPCLPLDVCLIIGEPIAGFVAEHHPTRCRWISRDEAVAVLEAEHKRGHVHHAFFKDAMLGRFYAICNCCACCCGAMQAMRNGIPMLAPSGYICRVQKELCEGCGQCIESCQFSALSMPNGVAEVDTDRCMGCGVCTSRCTRKAISLEREPLKGYPLEIKSLLKHKTA